MQPPTRSNKRICIVEVTSRGYLCNTTHNSRLTMLAPHANCLICNNNFCARAFSVCVREWRAMMSCCVKCFSQRQWEQITGAVSSYRLRAPHFIPTDFLFPSSSSSSSSSLAILDAVWLPAGGCCHCFLFCCLSILIRVVYAHCSSCHCALTSVPTWCIDTHTRDHSMLAAFSAIIGTVHGLFHICHSNVLLWIRNASARSSVQSPEITVCTYAPIKKMLNFARESLQWYEIQSRTGRCADRDEMRRGKKTSKIFFPYRKRSVVVIGTKGKAHARPDHATGAGEAYARELNASVSDFEWRMHQRVVIVTRRQQQQQNARRFIFSDRPLNDCRVRFCFCAHKFEITLHKH